MMKSKYLIAILALLISVIAPITAQKTAKCTNCSTKLGALDRNKNNMLDANEFKTIEARRKLKKLKAISCNKHQVLCQISESLTILDKNKNALKGDSKKVFFERTMLKKLVNIYFQTDKQSPSQLKKVVELLRKDAKSKQWKKYGDFYFLAKPRKQQKNSFDIFITKLDPRKHKEVKGMGLIIIFLKDKITAIPLIQKFD